MSEADYLEETFPVRVAARMTGLKPELIRAWEQRYGAVEPARTAGGTRRYSRQDVERLDLLRRVVDTGLRISTVAGWSRAELEAKLAPALASTASDADEAVLVALVEASEGQDAIAIRSLLDAQLHSLGPVVFAVDVALPFMKRVGDAWEDGSLSVASEHLATAIVRSMLLDLIEPAPEGRRAPRLIFATPATERHDLGLLAAAVVANRSGAEIVFLGADLPAEDLLDATTTSRADAVVIGLVCHERAQEEVAHLRKALPRSVALWIGGAGIARVPPVAGVERILRFRDLEAFVEDLRFPASGGRS